jgi:hypothetical protein
MKKMLLCLSLICLGNTAEAKEIPSLKNVRNAYFDNLNGKKATYFAFKKYLICNENMLLEDIEPTIISWFKESPTLFDYVNGHYVAEDDYEHEQSYNDDDDDESKDIDFELDEKFADQVFQDESRSLDLTNGEELLNQLDECKNSGDFIKLKRLEEIEQNLYKKMAHYIISKMTYLDDFINRLHAFTHYESELTFAQAMRCQEVIKALKNIGITQTLSNEFVDLFAQIIKLDHDFLNNQDKIYNFNNTYTVKEIIQTECNIVEKRIAIRQKLLAIYEQKT